MYLLRCKNSRAKAVDTPIRAVRLTVVKAVPPSEAPIAAYRGKPDLLPRFPDVRPDDPIAARASAALPLWPLPLLAGVLPVIAGLLAWQVSTRLELIPACNPFVEGCVSISRAARHGLPNHLFRAIVLPAAVLQGLTWWLASHWLRELALLSVARARALAAVGAAAAIFLVLYGTFLGTEGELYRWFRRFGIWFYFGLTAIALVVVVGLIARAARRGSTALSPRFGRSLLALAWVLLALGLAAAFSPLAFGDSLAHDRFTNVLEWWGAAVISALFAALAWAWRRTRFALRLAVAR